MGKLSKEVLTQYINSECDRQLVLNLGAGDSQWIFPNHTLIPLQRKIFPSHQLTKQGQIYEQEIYSQLKMLPNAIFQQTMGTVITNQLSAPALIRFKQDMMKNNWDEMVLLESEYQIPIEFLHDLFHLRRFTSLPSQISDQRPDILILFKGSTLSYDSELLPDGSVQPVSSTALSQKIGIRIIDIKHTHEKNVGKKQFVEILFYMRTFAYFLKKHQLDQDFYVSITNNGILPARDPTVLKGLSDLDILFIPLRWDESHRIFTSIYSKVQSLWQSCPKPLDQIPLNIQSTCGYCKYIDDCKNSLGHNLTDPKKWALELIPNTSASIVQQLKSYGFKTIEDVRKGVPKIKVGATPEPIYPELPLIKLKADALLKQRIVWPRAGHVHTYALPRYTPISLTFVLESDPHVDRVFGFALYTYMSVTPKSKNYLLFQKWWKIWYDQLALGAQPPQIYQELKNNLFTTTLDSVTAFFNSITALTSFEIRMPGTIHSGKKVTDTVIVGQSSELNMQLTDLNAEYNFLVKLIRELFNLLTICNIIENEIVVIQPTTYGKKIVDVVYRLDSGLFYWSDEQLVHFQEMMERHLGQLLKSSISPLIQELISWFTPSDSEVNHPYQHKKLYNLQSFVQTLIGFPGIISYSWHEIAAHSSIYGQKVSQRFWVPHYNYMDFSAWHEYVFEKDPRIKADKYSKIINQLMIKARTINRLRGTFQFEARDVISSNSKPMQITDYKAVLPPSNLHPLAQIWITYSKLNGAIEEYDAEYFRTIFPEFSIGKLRAAKVQNLTKIPGLNGHFYNFHLKGLSSNMKVKEHDRCLLIPDELRDMRIGSWMYKWIVIIRDMVWEPKINGYNVITDDTKNDLVKEYKSAVAVPSNNPDWYLYPTSNDPWTIKLFNHRNDGLLQIDTIGSSWLGYRLSNHWDIRSDYMPSHILQTACLENEVYLYAPEILETFNKSSISSKPISPLKTQIDPHPDASQTLAIENALNHVIFAIKGPPGTGKSQTITALVDEFLYRNSIQKPNEILHRPPYQGILITAFSYAAIRVLVEKIRHAKNKNGSLPRVSNTQMFFLRSDSQEPVENNSVLPLVHDVVRSGSTWKIDAIPKSLTKTNPLENTIENDFIIFANAHSLFHLRNQDRVLASFHFNLIIVDEASQLQVDYILASLRYLVPHTFQFQPIKNPLTDTLDLLSSNLDEPLTKLIIVGDDNQLPPVQPVEPPKNLENILKSLFSYYVNEHQIPFNQLETNYRSHQDIVEYTKYLGFYTNLMAHPRNATRIISGTIGNISKPWVRNVLDPQKVACALIHNNQFEVAVSIIEAELIQEIVVGFYEMVSPQTPEEEIEFWEEKVGVVSPHNAQGRLIIHKIYKFFTDNKLTLLHKDLMKYLKATVYSVEKFQGSDRELIISSIGLSDTDQLENESEFIYDLNRFNVLTSRAKSKIIAITSAAFLDYIPHDLEIMEYAAKSRYYSYEFCNRETFLFIPLSHTMFVKDIYFRWHENPQTSTIPSLNAPSPNSSSSQHSTPNINQNTIVSTSKSNQQAGAPRSIQIHISMNSVLPKSSFGYNTIIQNGQVQYHVWGHQDVIDALRIRFLTGPHAQIIAQSQKKEIWEFPQKDLEDYASILPFSVEFRRDNFPMESKLSISDESSDTDETPENQEENAVDIPNSQKKPVPSQAKQKPKPPSFHVSKEEDLF